MNVIPSSTLPKMRRRRQKRKAPVNVKMRAALQEAMGKVGYAIHQLMTRPKVPAFIGTKPVELESEQRLSIALSDRLRALSLQYYETGGEIGLRGTWYHNANERQAGWFTMLLLRAMGMMPGAPDYTFTWQNGGGHIELKVDGDLSEYQLYFRTWCQAFDVNHAVHRNVDDAIETLIKWGAIVGIPGRGALDVTKGENHGTEEQSV